jgi:hypothetical protein
MSRSTLQERRNSDRFPARLPLNLSVVGQQSEETLHAVSVNVSLNGVYCHVDRHIPLFNRTRVKFVNPDDTSTEDQIVSECEGIVVRVEPEHEERNRNEYHVALCFQRLFQQHREALHKMISSCPTASELADLAPYSNPG